MPSQDDEFLKTKELFEALVPEQCRGCSRTDLDTTFAALRVLDSYVSLEDQLALFETEMGKLLLDCTYGAAVSDGPGGPDCRWGIACEFNPRPSILDKDQPY